MTNLAKLLIFTLLLLLGTCLVSRRFPDEKTSNIEKVKKEKVIQPKIKKDEIKIPEQLKEKDKKKPVQKKKIWYELIPYNYTRKMLC